MKDNFTAAKTSLPSDTQRQDFTAIQNQPRVFNLASLLCLRLVFVNQEENRHNNDFI